MDSGEQCETQREHAPPISISSHPKGELVHQQVLGAVAVFRTDREQLTLGQGMDMEAVRFY
jgi:hypothetical protein